MKKLLSLLAIASLACTTLVGCNTGKPTDESKAKLTLSAVSTTVKINDEGTFSVTSDIAAPDDIVITAASSDEKFLKINDDSKSITIPKGETTVSGKFTGVSAGKADVTITSSNADISVGSVNVTVNEDEAPVENPDIITISLNYTSDPAPVAEGKDWCSFSFPSPDAGNDKWQVGGLWVTNRINSNEPGDVFNTCIENYGMSCVGKLDAATGKIHLSLIEKDVDISSLDFIDNENYNKEYTPWYWPVIYAENYKSLAGKSGYLVMNFIYSNSDKDIMKGIYPAWIKVNVAENGAVTVEDMALNCGDGPFATGQTK